MLVFQVVSFLLVSLYLMADAKMPPVKKTFTVKDADGKERTLVIHRGKGRHQLG